MQGPEPEKPLGELKSSGNVIRFVVLKAPWHRTGFESREPWEVVLVLFR